MCTLFFLVRNVFNVLKIKKQTSDDEPYFSIIKELWKKDGINFMFRGLKARLLVNGLQAIVFTICWKYFEKHIALYFTKKKEEKS